MIALPDENEVVGADLPTEEFEATQCLIIELCTKLFPLGSSRFSDMDVFMYFVDEVVAEIGYLWTGAKRG